MYVPVLRPRGPGGAPGRGIDQNQRPRAGNTLQNPSATIISNPPRPDNRRQTIQQAASPPELKIPVELRLPNLLLTSTVAPIAPPKAQSPAVRITRAAAEIPQQTKAPPVPARPAEVPRPVLITPELNLAALAAIANPSPRLPVPLPPLRITRIPQQPEPNVPPVPARPAEVPRPGPISPELNLDSLPAISNSSSRLPLLPPPMPEPMDVNVVGAASNVVGGIVVGGIIDTLVISVDPGPLPFPELPAGNREGAFSIAGSASGAGAVGGAVDGNPAGGRGGPGDGGNPSVGLGAGTSGGGGGATTASGIVSMDGKGNGKSGNGIVVLPDPAPVLPDSVPPNWIYPVTTLPATPRSGIVVSTGPVGGGGLGVYGVLRGGRISTTYLAMPHKNWILQYSPLPEASSAPQRAPAQAVVTVRDNLTPPWPEKKFDFRRPPIPPERSTRMIILHGRIREDGTVEELKVHQGVQTDADQIAMAAFRQWIFRPATRGGKPIPVEILVGIPAAGSKETL
ncbi:MAG: energy transducer TonB [Terriglobia bacterium]